MDTILLEEMVTAVDAAAPPSAAVVEEWVRWLPDASSVPHELTLVRQRLAALRPRAADQVEAVLASALETALQQVTLRAVDAALSDAVTGLPTRRLFERDCRRALAVAARTGRPVSVVMVDVDGLKKVNDTQGHAAGDVHLRAVADALRAVVREGDSAYRIGGDEFVVLLSDADPCVADLVMKRFCGPAVSWGVATSADGGADGDALLATADAQMYRTRHERRAATTPRPRSRGLAAVGLAAALAAVGGAGLVTVPAGLSAGDGGRAATAPGAGAPAAPRSADPEPRERITVVRVLVPVATADGATPPALQEVPVPITALPAALPAVLPSPPLPLPEAPAASPPVEVPAPPIATTDSGTVPALVEETTTLVEETVCALLCR